ncbi:MAG: hypothetical protein ABJL11_03665 [Parasphingorhabdus sp.]|uniref:COG3650 family protein n=1 Tax=Parasphingorhabdus sp. TaxID=2709688 RepID=UPI00329A4580
MKKLILSSLATVLALTGCEEPVAEAPAKEEKLGDYTASGTEPFWSAEVKGENITFSTPDGNDFTLPVARMNRTDTGWTVKGFSDQHNINLYITLGEECSDGMSDRAYADTVKVEVSDGGTLNGCGGDFEEGPDGPP